MGLLKGQSALEFLSTYSFAILIVTLVITMAALYVGFPKSILPPLCSFYSGLTCTDQVLAYNSLSGGARLLVFGTDAEPGIINISTFNAVLNYQNSTTSGCTPKELTAGQPFYCIANFSFVPSNSVTYTGVMKIAANYCAPSPNNISTANCIASNSVFYGGGLRLTPSVFTMPPNIIQNKSSQSYYYIPIKITNSQDISVPSEFQQMITFLPDNALFQSYEASNLGNIRFYEGGSELPSWCEANCSSSAAGNALFWVKLANPINPLANVTIDMRILSNSVNYDGVFAGENPTKSSQYAQFDNGAAVFNYYNNFEGSTVSSSFLQYVPSGASVTQDNGISINTGTASAAGLVLQNAYNPPFIYDVYIASQSGGAESGGTALQTGNAPTSLGYDFNEWTGSIGEGTLQTGMSGTQNIDLQVIVPGVDGQTWLSSTSQAYYKNYTKSSATSGDLVLPSRIYPSLGVYCCSGSNLMTINWIRIRDYPPNGAMPAVAFGALQHFT